jgi:hypothetical protein
MVNNSTRRQPSEQHPTDDERRIHDGPCHDLTVVKALIRGRGHKAVSVITENGTAEMLDYCMDETDIAELILKMTERNYHGSEWCKSAPKSPWFEADSYRVKRTEKIPGRRDIQSCNYYLKFSINKLNQILLFFSVHRDIL